jgi:Tetratricopeptide repeat
MYGNLGNVFGLQGQHKNAIHHHSRALSIAKEVGDKETEGKVLRNLDNTLGKMGDAVNGP